MRFCQLATLLALTMTLGLQPRVAADEAKSEEHPLAPAIKYAEACLAKVKALPGYEATFFKKEVVGRSMVSHKMKIKIRHKPFSVYLYFQNPHEGREVIYVEGQNNGKLIAHEAGLLSFAGTMELTPTDKMAMNENRYPITKAGIANTLEIMIERWRKEMQYGGTEVKYFNNAKLGSMKCRVVEATHPVPYKQFDNHIVRLWVDTATGIPVRMQKYGFPKRSGEKPPVIEEYTFMDFNSDVRLTDADFSRDNSKYNF